MNLLDELVQALGQLTGRLSLQLVAKILDKCLELGHLFHIRLVVDTVNECRGLLADSGGHISCNRLVCQQHEFLYEPVGGLGDFRHHVYRLSLLVHQNLHLRPFKADRAFLETFLAEDCGKLVKFQNGCDHLL